MAFMKKDVNFGLLLLIIATIILFVGFSVYYQLSFKKISLEYGDKLQELGDVTTELSVRKQELNETFTLRVRAEEDKRALDQRYKDASDDNTRLELDNARLGSELVSTNNVLAQKTSELDSTKVLLAKTQSDLSSSKSKASNLKSDLNEVCDDYTSLNGGVEHAEC